MMKFRIKGSLTVLIPQLTDEGTVVLLPERWTDGKSHYIDEYFTQGTPAPELEISVNDGVTWYDAGNLENIIDSVT